MGSWYVPNFTVIKIYNAKSSIIVLQKAFHGRLNRHRHEPQFRGIVESQPRKDLRLDHTSPPSLQHLLHPFLHLHLLRFRQITQVQGAGNKTLVPVCNREKLPHPRAQWNAPGCRIRQSFRRCDPPRPRPFRKFDGLPTIDWGKDRDSW